MSHATPRPAIAIIGIACRFPGHVNSPEGYWQLLLNGVDGVSDIPRDRFDIEDLYHPDPGHPGTLHIRRGGFADHAGDFDAAFFRISPREAVQMDPQQRMLLEVAWEALEDAGCTQEQVARSRTGVFIGLSTHDFANLIGGPLNRDGIGSHTATGTAASLAANRISHAFDLRGPSTALDTACSSSLTAVHLACQTLLAGDCDLALAGGVNLFLAPESAIGLAKASMLSPDGVCRAFDAAANGFVRGEGAGIVVLRRLDAPRVDRDRIYALIRGSAVNQDGRTAGITVPNGEAQEAMFHDALAAAGIEPGEVDYVEAHGTGTVVGDPIEAQAIGNVFSARRHAASPLYVGSVKTNIGHLEAAAGVAGLIKVALALRHRWIPPHLNFVQPNPAIPFDSLHLKVPVTAQRWPDSNRPGVAAVNSFGFGGANAHVLVEEAPRVDSSGGGDADSDRSRVLVISASHPASLRRRASQLAAFLADSTHSLDDVCHTANVRRSHLDHRFATVGRSRADIVQSLESFAANLDTNGVVGRAPAARPRLALVFTGMGPDLRGIGLELFNREPVFRSVLEGCDEVLRPMAGWSVCAALADPAIGAHVGAASFAQVANYSLQAGLVALLRSWRVVADAVIGHSVGEVAAAYAAGALSLEDGLRLVFHRGRLVDRLGGDHRMLAVALSERDARLLIGAYGTRVSVAAVNSAGSVTLSGDASPLEALATTLTERGVFHRFLSVSVPYHSAALDPLRDEFVESIADLAPRESVLAMASATAGRIVEGRDLDIEHWWRNLRECVRFADAATALVDGGIETYLQVGPHPVLQAYLREAVASRSRQGVILFTLKQGEGETTSLLKCCASLHVNGSSLDWDAVAHGAGSCISLPSYPWQHEPFGTGRDVSDRRSGRFETVEEEHPLLGLRLPAARPTWLARLDAARLSFLRDHRIAGTPVYPAAAYIEAALAARARVHAAPHASIEAVTFDKMLVLSRTSDQKIQVSCDPDGQFEIHSSSEEEGEWVRHAAGRWRKEPSASPRAHVDVASIQARCPRERNTVGWYGELQRAGFEYAGAFRSIEGVWEGDGEALGRLSLPASARTDLQVYCVHPGILDGALQLLVAAHVSGSATKPREMFLPTAIEHIDVLEPVGPECWAHATITRTTDSEIEGAVRLVDGHGRVLIDIRSARASRVGAPAERDRSDLWLHELRWVEMPLAPQSRPALLPPAAVIDSVLALPPLPASEFARVAYSASVQDDLNALAIALIGRTLRELGCDLERHDMSPADLAQSIGVDARHHRLLARLVQIVQAAPDPRVDDARLFAARLVERHGYWADIVDLIGRAGDALADVLRGTREAQAVLFAPDAFPVLSRAYTLFHSNRVLAQLAAAVVDSQKGARMRVLEVGAGTGAATADVLSRVPAGSGDYCFSDVSPFFLAQARQRFNDRPDVTFSLFDIEDGSGASLPFAEFDVIIAANVLHGTADLTASLGHLARLLAPDGLLIVLEVVSPEPWADLLFGLFQGWWRFSDVGLRPGHALLEPERWLKLFSDSGFDAVVAPFAKDGPDPIHEVFVAQKSLHADTAATVTPASRCTWIIVRDARGIGDRLAAAIGRRGHAAVLVDAGESLPSVDEGAVGLIHLPGVDLPGLADPSMRQPLEIVLKNLTDVTDLARACGSEPVSARELWLITSGAQHVIDDDRSDGALQLPIWAVGRVMMEELPGLRCRLADLSAAATEEEIEALAVEVTTARDEEEIAFRSGRRFVARIAQVNRASADLEEPETSVSAAAHQVRVEIDEPGNLESLSLRVVRPEPPASDEILIRVHAAGLNFKDVMHALGLVPFAPSPRSDTRQPLGFECSGVVLEVGDAVERFRPGDHVCGIGTATLASHARLQAQFAFHRPMRLDAEDAAGVLLPFMTARFALHDVARIQAGERVLIHSAAGGVGLAALQMCRNAGVDVFATAGTPEKRTLLESLGIEHVMDSRSLDFADRVREITRGEGVDVVLNSLAGPAIGKGLSILRPFGRFVEIGKRDFLENSRLEMAPFERHLSFFAVDLDRVRTDRPDTCATLARKVLAGFETGELQALPRTTFELADVRAAFRHMAQARHVGKIVLTPNRDAYGARATRAQLLCSPRATYLVTGGLGGFGLATARWLVEQGARNVVLVGRQAEPLPQNRRAFDALLMTGANVTVLAADVAIAEDVRRVLGHIRQHLPPLRGVFHEAMVLDDQLLFDLTPESWSRVLAPKLSGAWNLHRLTHSLDYFVLFSSATVMLGNVGQANYAASNAFLDALARYRAGLGLPALSVGWGSIGDVGLVAGRHDLLRHFERIGFQPFTAADACTTLERLLRRGCVYSAPFRMNWRTFPGSSRSRYADIVRVATQEEQRGTGAPGDQTASTLTDIRAGVASREGLDAHLLETVAKVLGIAPERLDVDTPMINLGLDSLMAVELESVIRKTTGLEVAAVRLLQGLSVRALATSLSPERSRGGPETPSTSRRAERKRLPLAPGQRRFWFLHAVDPSSVAYNMSLAVEISGSLDAQALEAAFNEVVRHQEALRVTFTTEEGEPVQSIAPERWIPMRLTDISADVNGETTLDTIAAEESRRAFDLAEGPLISTRLVRLAEGRHVLLATAHHLIVDAWSAGIIMKQVADYYRSYAAGRTPAPGWRSSYSDVVRRQISRVEEREPIQLEYWTRQLRDMEPLRLRAIRPQDRVDSTRLAVDFPRPLHAALDEMARREGTTLFTVLLAAFELLLARYSGREDVCIGTPVTTRSDDDSRELVGCFVNTLAVRLRLTPSMTFRDLLRQTSERMLGASEHQDVPWERIVEHLNPERAPGRVPILQALFVFHSFSMGSAELPGLVIESKLLDTGVSPFDLMLIIDTHKGRGAIESNGAFDSETIASMSRIYTQVLADAVHNPNRLITDFARSNPFESRGVDEDDVHAPGTEVQDAGCLHELFEREVSRAPDAVAVMSSREVITYRQLDAAAHALSCTLRKHGVARGTLVVVALERSPHAVVAMLAVLKAGGAFVPVDCRWPGERVRLIVEDTRAVVLLTEDRFSERFADQCGELCPTIAVDDPAWEAPRQKDEIAAGDRVTPGDCAYVLYTSGSTGRPKGVLVEHAAICSQIAWRQSVFPLHAQDAVLQSTSLTFDPSVWEIFGPLSTGAKIVISGGEAFDGAAWNDVIRQHDVTTVQVVPSILRSLIDQSAFDGCQSLRRVFCGGEALDATLRHRFFGAVGAELVNLYGCTETAIDATYHRCGRDELDPMTPIGRPIARTRLHIVDDSRRPVPDGVDGELCVAGPGVARGYLNDPDLTARRFITEPLAPNGARAFLTGDIVRRLPGGEIEFLERRDRQLKVRGCRIDATEVEVALRRHPAVREATVGVCENPHSEASLVAWVVSTDGELPSPSMLRTFLAGTLPEFMLPDRYVWVESVPRLPSGKVDVRKLPRTASGEWSVPRDEIENAMVRLWEEMLGAHGIGISDSFFDLGGHSLLAVRLAAQMSDLLGWKVRCSDVMTHRTIAEVLSASREATAQRR